MKLGRHVFHQNPFQLGIIAIEIAHDPDHLLLKVQTGVVESLAHCLKFDVGFTGTRQVSQGSRLNLNELNKHVVHVPANLEQGIRKQNQRSSYCHKTDLASVGQAGQRVIPEQGCCQCGESPHKQSRSTPSVGQNLLYNVLESLPPTTVLLGTQNRL